MEKSKRYPSPLDTPQMQDPNARKTTHSQPANQYPKENLRERKIRRR
jgi:hypothetical protein